MTAEHHRCERHHRLAVAARLRRRGRGKQKVEYLCEIDLAEERLSRPLGSKSPFDDFFADALAESASLTSTGA